MEARRTPSGRWPVRARTGLEGKESALQPNSGMAETRKTRPGDGARSAVARLAAALRGGSWLDAERARTVPRLLLAVLVVVSVGAVGVALPGGVTPWGKLIGTDFASFWTASRLSLAGQAASAYDPAVLHAAETELSGGLDTGFFAFFYPPAYLALCLPLALLPYLASLSLWLASTAALCWLALRRLVGASLPVVAALAFPAVAINAWHGQNAFLTTALLAAGIHGQRSRPVLAGAAFGLLVLKPQLALAVPVLLAVRGCWKGLAAAAATAALVCIAATIVFGPSIWIAYAGVAPLSRAALEEGLVGFGKMQSVFSGARLLGAGIGLAYGVQVAAGLWAAAMLILPGRSAPHHLAGAAAICATVLMTPFLLDYDLMVLAIPLLVLAREGVATGFRPWERTLLAIAYVWPLVTRSIATGLSMPLTPLVAMGLLLALTRRARGSRNGGAEPAAALGDPERHGSVA
jgi:alpha-1,2-mannosyltransferase